MHDLGVLCATNQYINCVYSKHLQLAATCVIN